MQAFQSAPPVRGATVKSCAECDAEMVSIRAPRAGGDRRAGWAAQPVHEFQSAPPVRGATQTAGATSRQRSFNPRPPCGGRLKPPARPAGKGVSIRAPRAGGDRSRSAIGNRTKRFNPRPPCGGRLDCECSSCSAEVSIRAPRAGGDGGDSGPCVGTAVSIRAPRAGGDRRNISAGGSWQIPPLCANLLQPLESSYYQGGIARLIR